ncbi:MAG: LamG-like jellyroll fold domain-containing protein, partial [Sedimentisphaerales bacterium]|nr:LamG-like jellyroll fold domain-containing protein [Sedimentisphaerales bacterium]
NHWTLQFDTSNPRKLIIYHPGGSWETGICLGDIAGAWHNITIVRHKTGSDSFMWSYLDGSHIKTNDKWNTAPGNGNGHLNIGADMTASSSYVFKGLIDELKIYDSSATDGSVTPPGSLIGYWSFDKSGTGMVNVYAAPHKTAVIVWSGSPSTATRWGQAGGAFFRTITRN